MSEQETLALVAKLTAEMNAIAVVVGEIIVAQSKAEPNPIEHLAAMQKRIERFLKQSPLAVHPHGTEMLEWAKHRAELVFLFARRSLAES